jgi:hypothetical protein
MTLRKLLLPALAVLLLSSAAMRRAAQGQTTSTGLSGSWIGVATLPPPLANGLGGTLPIMLSFNSNGTVTLVTPNKNNGSGSDSVAVGTWVSTADGQFAVTTNSFDYDNNGNYRRSNKLRIALSVSGSQMSGNAEFVVSDPTSAAQDSVPGITFTATPIAVETIGSM